MGILSVSRSVQKVVSGRVRTEARLQIPHEKPGWHAIPIGQLVRGFTPFSFMG